MELFERIFEKPSRIKFRKKPFIGCRIVSCGQKDKRADLKKLRVAFLNFANEPKINKTYKLHGTNIFQKLALGIM